jgi:hypothetical protein
MLLHPQQAKPGKVAAAAKTRNANPMRNRVATGLKAKPMPATATTMVKVSLEGCCIISTRGGAA